jgi:hypothetical protein
MQKLTHKRRYIEEFIYSILVLYTFNSIFEEL